MLPSKSICMRTPIWSFKWRREWDSSRFAVPCSHLRLYNLCFCRPRHELALPSSAPWQRSSSFPHGRSHVTGFQELKRCSALLSKLNIFCHFTYAFADISPTAVSRNYYSKWENYCQKLKNFHLESNIHLHMDNYHPFRNYTNSRTGTKWATVLTVSIGTV